MERTYKTKWESLESDTYLTPEEARAIIDSAWEHSRYPERDTLLLETLWQTGGRLQEVITLTVNRIGSDSLRLDNLKQKPRRKPGQKDIPRGKPEPKTCYVSDDLISRLKTFCRKHHLEGEYCIFYPNPNAKMLPHVYPMYVWRLVIKLARINNIYKFKRKNKTVKGVYVGPKFREGWPHLFRHGCAMHILDSTDSTELVQRQLGHAYLETSQAYARIKADKAKKRMSDIKW